MVISTKQKQMKVKEHNLIKVKLSSLKFDDTNPNTLTEKQMDGLRASMKQFGYLTPIVIDQNNKIADGEHRALIYKEFGLTEISAYKLNLDNIQRKMLRQTMNKLRGEHEINKDTLELLTILEAGKLTDLSVLIAQEQKSMEYLIKKYQEQQESFQDALNESKDITTNNKCPKCGYEWSQ
jgi:ParB-like chromosome segregation protein Spo0J